jgi:hypothetical protein
MRTRLLLAACLLALLAAPLVSCRGSGDASIKLAPTPPLSKGQGWAVVKVAYARLKEKPSVQSRDLAHLRRGSVVEIEGRELGEPGKPEDRGFWFKLKAEGSEGYMREGELDVFSTKGQAERSSASYQ